MAAAARDLTVDKITSKRDCLVLSPYVEFYARSETRDSQSVFDATRVSIDILLISILLNDRPK